MIKRIFSDMDGTLLDNTGAVSEENVSLIKSAGIPMTLVSARAPIEQKVTQQKPTRTMLLSYFLKPKKDL